LGLPDPDERLFKARLMHPINAEIQRRALTQEAAGELVVLKQLELSRIANGRGAGFSTERLIAVLRRLGRHIEL
jgi:predicted XRE-type DNA-binding protein